MAKHTLKEILSIFASHVGHTHEAAVQATYDAGHARAREEFAAGLAAPAAAAPEGETSNGNENKTKEGGKAKTAEEPKAAANPAA